MPSTDRRLELKEKTLMAQTVWQPVVYVKGLTRAQTLHSVSLVTSHITYQIHCCIIAAV